ncbi:hypothetical protein M0R45_028473 [Rubus argutus]|uniref:Uncharacterized protein n=1 Tax=Rubus argutus TaxID=59490 RepID=A0AAW1W5A0_RUBAR
MSLPPPPASILSTQDRTTIDLPHQFALPQLRARALTHHRSQTIVGRKIAALPLLVTTSRALSLSERNKQKKKEKKQRSRERKDSGQREEKKEPEAKPSCGFPSAIVTAKPELSSRRRAQTSPDLTSTSAVLPCPCSANRPSASFLSSCRPPRALCRPICREEEREEMK